MSGGDLNIIDVTQHVYKARWRVIFGALIGAIAAVILLSVIPSSYRAVMIVAPADGYALGDYASAHGGTSATYDKIVSLPFWRPMEPEGISTDFYRFVQTARGPAAAEILRKDDTIRTALADKDMASASALSDYMTRRVDIQPVGATPLRRITYYHPDPEFAAAFLRKAHLVADQMIRRDRRRMAQARIDYLSASLERTANPDHRRIITGLLMQQEHILMLANLDEPYAAIIVEPAAASARPVWPDRPMTIAGFALLGAMLGYLYAVWRRS
jgi:hypothetical protein